MKRIRVDLTMFLETCFLKKFFLSLTLKFLKISFNKHSQTDLYFFYFKKLIKNHFYLFFKNYFLFHFILKLIFKEPQLNNIRNF